ncbi:MAG: hypothetical protein OES79_10640 [Planctomycetota bacterium]|nr:hypothetical protein [Planctomycetota bacterium]
MTVLMFPSLPAVHGAFLEAPGEAYDRDQHPEKALLDTGLLLD